MIKKIPFMLRFSKHSVAFFSTLLENRKPDRRPRSPASYLRPISRSSFSQCSIDLSYCAVDIPDSGYQSL